MRRIIVGVNPYDSRAVRVYLSQLIADGPRGTQAALARHLDAQVATVNKWAQRQNCPAPNHWPGIESFFGLEPGTIAGIGGIPSRPDDLESAILAAKDLTDEGRDVVLRVYRALRDEAVLRERPSPPGSPPVSG